MLDPHEPSLGIEPQRYGHELNAIRISDVYIRTSVAVN